MVDGGAGIRAGDLDHLPEAVDVRGRRAARRGDRDVVILRVVAVLRDIAERIGGADQAIDASNAWVVVWFNGSVIEVTLPSAS